MKNIGFYTVLAIAFALASCNSETLSNPLDDTLRQTLNKTSPTGSYQHYILPKSTEIENLPQDPQNPISKGKVDLGKMLFFETGLALAPNYEFSKGFYSCSSCHVPEAGFMPGRVQGIADGGIGFGQNGEMRDRTLLYQEHELDVQGARPLSLINVAFSTNTSWAGAFGAGDANEALGDIWSEETNTEVNHLGYSGLESQNIEGLKLHRMVVNPTVIDTLGYKEMYDACFPDFPEEDRYNEITTSLAISAYLRSLISNEAPFQHWLKGNLDAMDNQGKEGAKLFFGKAGCFRCHNSPALNDPNHFYALGVKDLFEAEGTFNTNENDIRNFGRGFFTGYEYDMFKFKVPQLYNMGAGNFFFHGSSKTSLREVVEYFNDGIPENTRVPSGNMAAQFTPLGLSDKEIEDLTHFLKESLYDPDMNRYQPSEVLSGNCFPNNDPLSRANLGCN